MPKTARPSRARSASPSTLLSSHSIFVAEKYGSSTRPVRSRTSGSWPCRAQLVAARGGAAVLPDERAVQRLAGRRVPAQTVSRWLVIPTAVELARADAGVLERLAGDRARDVPDLRRVVLDPAGLREVLAELAVGAADQLGLARRRPGTSCRSCPGRSRGSRLREPIPRAARRSPERPAGQPAARFRPCGGGSARLPA